MPSQRSLSEDIPSGEEEGRRRGFAPASSLLSKGAICFDARFVLIFASSLQNHGGREAIVLHHGDILFPVDNGIGE